MLTLTVTAPGVLCGRIDELYVLIRYSRAPIFNLQTCSITLYRYMLHPYREKISFRYRRYVIECKIAFCSERHIVDPLFRHYISWKKNVFFSKVRYTRL